MNQELSSAGMAALDRWETKTLPAVNKTNTNYRPNNTPNVFFMSVMLMNRVEANLSANPAYNAGTVQFRVKNKQTQAVVALLDTEYVDERWIAVFDQVGADQMRVEYQIVTLVNGAEVGNTRTWSVEGEVAAARAGSDENREDLFNALLTYGDSAAAYLAS